MFAKLDKLHNFGCWPRRAEDHTRTIATRIVVAHFRVNKIQQHLANGRQVRRLQRQIIDHESNDALEVGG